MTDSPRKDEELDDDLDLDLSSMRSMFREMREEEPSDKGMAALLTAAREKAEEMKPKRSWFAVLLEQLRRPPVLAMATVVVLIGGAVVISQRDDMKAETEAVSQSARAPGAVADRAESAPSGGALDEGGAPSAGVPAPAAEAEEAHAPPPVVSRPAAKSSGSLSAKQKPADSVDGKPVRAPKKELESRSGRSKDDVAPMAIASDDDMAPKGGAVATESAAPQSPPAPVSRKPLPSIEGEDRMVNDASVAQLLKQCEVAAAKNDCASVRSIAAKIAKQDPQTYKNRVLKSASISRCLEPPAPDAASEPTN